MRGSDCNDKAIRCRSFTDNKHLDIILNIDEGFDKHAGEINRPRFSYSEAFLAAHFAESHVGRTFVMCRGTVMTRAGMPRTLEMMRVLFGGTYHKIKTSKVIKSRRFKFSRSDRNSAPPRTLYRFEIFRHRRSVLTLVSFLYHCM